MVGDFAVGILSQFEVVVYLVPVPAPFLLYREVAGAAQIGDDLADRALGHAELVGELGPLTARVHGDEAEYGGVQGQERPFCHIVCSRKNNSGISLPLS